MIQVFDLAKTPSFTYTPTPPDYIMALSYLGLALVLAFSLNSTNRFVRAGATFIAALALCMIVLSILLADFDGSFSGKPSATASIDPFKPLILNIQAAIATVAAAFLFLVSWLQARRRTPHAVPPVNTASAFGLISRYAHWITATLILCLVPMGLFISVLKAESPERSEFLAAHQSLGLAVFAVAGLRLLWLLISPPPAPPPDSKPWERRLSLAVHASLYGLILAFPLSGFLMSAYGGETVQFFGWVLPQAVPSSQDVASLWTSAHDLVLPALFYVLIFAHLGAALKHHFVDRRKDAIRRMLT